MKNRIYLYLAFILLSISCKKDDVPINIFEPGAMEFGSAMAEKNGLQWQASAEAKKSKLDKNKFLISLCTYNAYDEKRESIGFLNIPYQTGKYPVYTCNHNIPDSCMSGYVSSHYARLSSDGDAVLAFYNINENKNSYLNITTIDTTADIVTGDFEIHVKLSIGGQFLDPADPDNLDFTKGTFECRFSN